MGAPRILLIEDFGTTGLLGAIDQKDDRPFSDFWRRIGKSHKSGKQGGRRGLGKLVFSGISRARTFFGLTVRSDDPSRTPVLMGQAVLATHRDEQGRDVDAHGFFCQPRPSDRFQLPEINPTLVGHFARATGMSRTNESGLSIAVPFVREDIQPKDLIQQLVRNYYFPILMGQLESQIDDVKVEATSFDALAKAYGGSQFENGKLISFIRDIRSAIDRNAPDLSLAEGALGNLEAALSDEQVIALRSRYTAGELVHVRMNVRLRHRRDGEVKSHFDVFMRATDGDGQALVVRGAITLPQEASQFRARRAFGALIAQDAGITEFLGDAENPAHTKWNGNAEKLTLEWVNPATRLREIRQSLNALAIILTQAQEKIEPDALIDVLSIPAPAGRAQPAPRPVPDPRPFPPLPQTKRKFLITQRTGGFTLASTAALNETDLPLEIRVAAAYDIVRGDPFRKHDPLDFNLQEPDGPKIASVGAAVRVEDSNKLTVLVESANFSVAVTGFDVNRDLVVRAGRQGQ
jgi:hypothetical protein